MEEEELVGRYRGGGLQLTFRVVVMGLGFHFQLHSGGDSCQITGLPPVTLLTHHTLLSWPHGGDAFLPGSQHAGPAQHNLAGVTRT